MFSSSSSGSKRGLCRYLWAAYWWHRIVLASNMRTSKSLRIERAFLSIGADCDSLASVSARYRVRGRGWVVFRGGFGWKWVPISFVLLNKHDAMLLLWRHDIDDAQNVIKSRIKRTHGLTQTHTTEDIQRRCQQTRCTLTQIEQTTKRRNASLHI